MNSVAIAIARDSVRHRDDVSGERSCAVAGPVAAVRALVLPAQVDSDHGPAGRGERLQDRQEVLLAARVTVDQQGGPAVRDAASWLRLENGEPAASGRQ